MKQNLVIVESPSKAGAIKSYLGSGYKVMASNGHIRDLKKQGMSIDIENDFAPQYKTITGKGDIVKELKKEAKKSDRVYLATDPDREGEAISWHLATVLDIPVEKTERITFNEITKNAVKSGIKNPRNIDMNLVNAQQTRRILDRIVGYSISPFLCKTISSGLSGGRVQSAGVKIIVDRENEIRSFVPEEFWTIEASLISGKTSLKTKFYGKENEKIDLRCEDDVKKIISSLGEEYTVEKIKKSTKLKNPPSPFTTSSLQQEASRRLSFSPGMTMRIAQSLYEGINLGAEHGGTHGLITYMRTDSLRISDEARGAAMSFITGKYGAGYYPKTPRIYKTSANAQDAHEAIRPADVNITPDDVASRLTPDQLKLYRLIWNRFVASQMASAELDTVAVDVANNGYIFKASGYTVRFDGYQKLYDDTAKFAGDDKNDEDGEKKALPPLREEQVFTAEQVKPSQHFTEPPPRFSEGTFIKFLEENGIGRPSTYASIVGTITDKNYVRKDGKVLKPTELGEKTNELISKYFPDIVDCNFTAEMESDLDKIAAGGEDMVSFLHGFYEGFEKSVNNASSCAKIEMITDIPCNKCGEMMEKKNGRFGMYLCCPNCDNKKSLNKDGTVVEKIPDEPTDRLCEKCSSPMVIKTGRFGKYYACTKCKATKSIDKTIGVKCPVCGAEIIEKRAKANGKLFYGCQNYPACHFGSYDLPTNEKCPVCGEMLYVRGKKTICKNTKCSAYVKTGVRVWTKKGKKES